MNQVEIKYSQLTPQITSFFYSEVWQCEAKQETAKNSSKAAGESKKKKKKYVDNDVIKILAFILLSPYYFYVLCPFS